MGLRLPDYAFTIPSIHDDVSLDCRLYHPRKREDSSATFKHAAIVAHPYAPTGGSADDPVVGAVVRVLLDTGYIACTFSFRYRHRLSSICRTNKPEGAQPSREVEPPGLRDPSWLTMCPYTVFCCFICFS